VGGGTAVAAGAWEGQAEAYCHRAALDAIRYLVDTAIAGVMCASDSLALWVK
jgi:hypothetical protein